MDQKQIRVLLIEDDHQDVNLIRRLLSEISDISIQMDHVKSLSSGLELLGREEVDVVLLDLSLPDSRGADDLLTVEAAAQGSPIIVLGNVEDPALEIEVISKGAQDYLVKSRLNSRAMMRILRNTIERQKVKTALEKVVLELRHLNQLKSDFISSVSHELHTPLTVITVTVNNFLDGIFGRLDETQTKWLLRLKSNAERLTNLINDILDLSKLESGRAKLNWKKFNLGALMNKVLDDIGPMAQDKGVQISRQIPQDVIEIYAAQTRIEQVMVNLVTNSIKYSPSGGQVAVHLERSSDSAQVEVSDTGMGIDPSKLDVIFERFLQLAEDKTTSPGIGLGLAICKEIIQIHHGKIWAESEGVGKGSRFIFTLPSGLREIRAKKPTVLVVDNDEDVLDLFKTILIGLGYQTLFAKDGAEAIAQIVSSEMRTPIDILVVDLFLPVRNGLEVIKEIKRVNPKAFIVMVTGHHDSQLLSEAMEFSSFTLLKKPFDVEEARRILGSLAASALEKGEGEKN